MTTERVFVVISTSEDGDVDLERVRESELIKRLNEDYYGGSPILTTTDLEEHQDLRERHGVYIVAGDLIAPKAKVYDLGALLPNFTEWTL